MKSINITPSSAWEKFIGTHARYDQIDVETVNDY